MAADQAYIPFIRRLRFALKDFQEVNVLIESEENEEEELQFFIEDSIEYINNAFQPKTLYTVSDIPNLLPWYLVREGAVLEAIKSNMISSARNQHTYSDTGGATEQDQDVYGRYINIYNVLRIKFEDEVRKFKIAVNTDNGYGAVSSEFSLRYDED